MLVPEPPVADDVEFVPDERVADSHPGSSAKWIRDDLNAILKPYLK